MEITERLHTTSREQWREWLVENHSTKREIWISTTKSPDGLQYLDAVEEALCFGWIDSTIKAGEGVMWRRFSPRRKRSPWTELNKERCRRLERWFDSEYEFEVRFAVVVAMCYFLNKEWLDKVFECINGLNFDHIKSKYKTVKGKPKVAQQGTVQGTEPYYVRMGVAWLLATALAKFPDQTGAFVRSSNLPADVTKLYIRKACESFRTRTVEAL